MKLQKYTVQACCGNTSVMYRVSESLSVELIAKLVQLGFNEQVHFTNAGILYVDNLEFILTGPIGSDKLQVKCKKRNCDSNLNNLEILLMQI
jgi:Ni,Fe-hydrogenase I small subunit